MCVARLSRGLIASTRSKEVGWTTREVAPLMQHTAFNPPNGHYVDM